MALSNKRGGQDDHIDRISGLPCNAIDGILAHLDIKDLVGTSILSKQWRYKWTKAPRLWFSDDFFEEYEDLDDPVAYKIITDVLKQHKGPIDKFGLFISYDYRFEITVEHLNTWIPILSRCIKHLELVNYSYAISLDQMPFIVLSCKELTYFKFSGFDLSIPPDFCGFKKLLELHLVFVRFEPDALESLISGCPLLKHLHIASCEDFEYFDFAIPTLEVLLIEFNPSMKSICLEKAHNLIDLTIEATRASGLIKSLPKNIKRISIHPPLNNKIQYADIIPPKLLKSSFSSIKYLKLYGLNLSDRGELLYIVSVLESAHSLVELECYSDEDISQEPDDSEEDDDLEELECTGGCLSRLMKVTIDVRSCSQHVMSLIEFILANSTSLEALTLKVGLQYPKLDAPILLSISEELLWMRRASQKAHVMFYY